MEVYILIFRYMFYFYIFIAKMELATWRNEICLSKYAYMSDLSHG